MFPPMVLCLGSHPQEPLPPAPGPSADKCDHRTVAMNLIGNGQWGRPLVRTNTEDASRREPVGDLSPPPSPLRFLVTELRVRQGVGVHPHSLLPCICMRMCTRRPETSANAPAVPHVTPQPNRTGIFLFLQLQRGNIFQTGRCCIIYLFFLKPNRKTFLRSHRSPVTLPPLNPPPPLGAPHPPRPAGPEATHRPPAPCPVRPPAGPPPPPPPMQRRPVIR